MSRGFTMVELLIVLVILAIVVGTTAPALARIGEEEPSVTATRDLTGLVRSARRTAIERGVATALIVDTRSGRYWIGPESATPETARAGVMSPETRAFIVGPTERAQFVFDPEGLARGDSLILRTAAGDLVLGVNRWTGAPYVR